MKRYRMSTGLVKALQENENVEMATEYTVQFTEKFKQLAYDEYIRGKSMREIFTEAGFDVLALGTGRIQNFRNKLMRDAESETGFADRRKLRESKAPLSTEAQMAKRIRELEHRNAYLEQENEFLKKIQELEQESAGKAGGRK